MREAPQRVNGQKRGCAPSTTANRSRSASLKRGPSAARGQIDPWARRAAANQTLHHAIPSPEQANATTMMARRSLPQTACRRCNPYRHKSFNVVKPTGDVLAGSLEDRPRKRT